VRISPSTPRESSAQRCIFEPPGDPRLCPVLGTDEFAERLIVPVLEVTSNMLTTGGFLGRVLCQIDFLSILEAVRVERFTRPQTPYVPIRTDLVLPADPSELRTVACYGARLLARSVGVPSWDPPIGHH
jgi:hypothetical protein